MMQLIPLDLSLDALDAIIKIVDFANEEDFLPEMEIEFFPRSAKLILYPDDAVRSSDDFGRFWQMPTDLDNKIMDAIWAGLNSNDRNELAITIYKIPKLLEDFPVEFFLQPPLLYQVCE